MRILQLYKKRRTEQRLIRGVRDNCSKISSNRELTCSQKKEIKQYYQDLLGIDIPLDWHRYFYKRTGVYSVKYIPTSLYYTEIIGRINQMQFERAYSDKNITELLLSGVKHPTTILKNMNGYYYADGTALSLEEAIETCWNIDDVIIKPTLKSHGDGVKKFECHDGITNVDGKHIKQLLGLYNKNFIIQKIVKQNEQMSRLNPSSVNTLRIVTYRSGMEVLMLYAVVRIGRQGWEIDNESAGGISTKINADGTLSKYAYGAPGNDHVERTDTGIVLDGFKVPYFNTVVQSVKNLHLQLPHFNLIGWDMTVDNEGTPILIEWNVWPELSQSANGPAFGDYTERIFKEIWNRPNTRPY